MHILNLGCRGIINDLDVIVHGFMLQITYITVFSVKRLANVENRGINITYSIKSLNRYNNCTLIVAIIKEKSDNIIWRYCHYLHS